MKIITVVGIRGSGKTTVTEALEKEMTARGLTVGTVKTIFCPTFHMDKPGSNTYRHTRAGAAVVTARAETETSVLYPRKLKPSEILRHYAGCGAVIFEGDYELPAARIVTAHGEEDALERLNERTVAVSGLISNSLDRLENLTVLHPERDISALTDLVLEKAEDVKDPETLDAGLDGEDLKLSRAFCAAGCKGHGKMRTETGVRLTVDGHPVRLDGETEKELRQWLAQRMN
ncbi:MAG: molybdopterin-guanine dinucleotide biosynthesis protein MobB [Clostridia bacterium]|nr:molybdopterin-guanine dinucleotide biosynthesis protein MobB [Clostridia bacterium]